MQYQRSVNLNGSGEDPDRKAERIDLMERNLEPVDRAPRESSEMSVWCLFAIFCLLATPGWAASDGCPGDTTANQVTAGFNLSGRIAVVTGGDSGLGFAIAKAL